MIEGEEVYTTQINLSAVDNLSVLQQRLRQVIVQLDVAQLEVRAVAEPEVTGLVVVGVAL
jgi:hypothetical protein